MNMFYLKGSDAELLISQYTKDAFHEDDTSDFCVSFSFDKPKKRGAFLKLLNLEPSE
ncbi:hypothetical protein J32TS2_35330 [Shouchella clausii]|nr:hypothetical protein J1TS1_35750 [Shouchella clausii]GIN18177.1 hypothetical protein J32TS2_35330 [Shouchella clausii]